MIGLQFTKIELNQKAGQIAKDVNTAFRQVRELQDFFSWKPNEDLLALGFTPEEVNDIKAAYTRLDALRQIYEGLAAQGATPEDFRAFPKRLWGI